MFQAFYSDPHFGHKNIIGFCARPFANVEDMERGLIERYNAVVGPDDFVLWVGDCFFTSHSKASEILRALNGRKALVRGNHDRSHQRMVQLGFEFAADEIYFAIGEHRLRAVHYPYRNKSEKGPYTTFQPEPRKGVVLMHGHSHGKDRTSKNAVHVGVDAWDYRPALLHEVEAILGGFPTTS